MKKKKDEFMEILRKMAKITNCPSCRNEIQPSDEYCPKCRASLKEDSVCWKCRKPVKAGDKYCGGCGSLVSIAVDKKQRVLTLMESLAISAALQSGEMTKHEAIKMLTDNNLKELDDLMKDFQKELLKGGPTVMVAQFRC